MALAHQEFSRRRFLAAAGVSALALGARGEAEAEAGELPPLTRGPGDAPDWGALRRRFLLAEGLAYFNCATLGPSPLDVLRAAGEAWRRLEANPADEYFGRGLAELEEVRAKAAALLGCDLGEVALMRNTTDGMNTIAQGLNLQAGQRVLTTDQEHPGGVVCWEYYAQRRGVLLERVKLPAQPRSADELLARFDAAMRPDTAVVSVSHVTFSTGLRLPIARLAERVHGRGALLVVDGAQAVGGLRVHVRELGCDAYATSGHKWLLGPTGTGLLYLAQAARPRIDPLLLQHGLNAYTATTGTRDLPGLVGLGAALDLHAALGADRVEARLRELRGRLLEGLRRLPAVTLVSPPDSHSDLASPIASVRLADGADSAALAARLRQRHGVIVRVVAGELFNGLRFSPYLGVGEEQIERLLRALRAEL